MTNALDQACEALAARYRAATPRSQALHEAACAVLPAGNTRSNLYFAPYPPTIARGEGSRLFDADGNAYVDFLNDYSVALCGHSHPRLLTAAGDVLKDGMSYGGCITAEVTLGNALRRRFPLLEHIRFANSGTEASLYAVLTALQFTGKSTILAFHGAYHGGMMNYGPGGDRLNVPLDRVMVPYNDIAAFDAAIAAHGDRLGAVVMDLMLNSAGCIPADPDFARHVRAVTAMRDIPLIIDEVMTARLGYGGLQQAYGVEGDLAAFGKIIGGGFSAGAFGGRADMMAVYDTRGTGTSSHGGSFNNNVFSMKVGTVALTEVLTPEVMRAVNDRGDALRHRLNTLFQDHDVPLYMTGIGSVMNVHVGRTPLRRAPTHPASAKARRLLHLHQLCQGFWTAPRGMIALSIVNTDAEIDSFVTGMADFLALHAPILRDLEPA